VSYSIYSTPSIIIQSYDLGESDRAYRILTEDFGVIFAKAKNIRGESSKLRYNIEIGERITLDLVRGKESFRITGVHKIKGTKKLNKNKSLYFQRILTFLGVLSPFEENGGSIFKLLNTIYEHLNDFVYLSQSEIEFLESLYKSHILDHLGYWNSENLLSFPENRKKLLLQTPKTHILREQVYTALQASQLKG
jgi:recombinational DNA repair protein (RecF pathway)